MCAAVAGAESVPVDSMASISSTGKLLFTEKSGPLAFTPEVMARAMIQIREQRKAREDCDVIFEAKDGTQIWAHRFVLSAKYSGCRILFTAATETFIPDKEQEEEEEWIPPIRVTVTDMSGDVLELLVEFAYYAPLHEHIGFQNVGKVLDVAKDYNITTLFEYCLKMLRRNLDPDTCIGTYRLAVSKGCNDLARDAFRVLVRNFHEVWQNSVEFPSLTPAEMRAILADNHLHSPSEAEGTFPAILKWISEDAAKRRKYLAQFLPLVRFFQCSARDCEKVVTNPQVQADGDSVDVLNVIHQTLWRPSMVVGVCAGVDLSSKRWLTPRIPKNIIFLFGGSSRVAATSDLLTYNCRTRRWRELGDQNTMPRSHHAVVVINSCIYYIGGKEGRQALHTIACLEVNCNRWTQKANMSSLLGDPAAAALQGRIYAIGGWDGLRHTNTVERYDPKRNAWSSVASMGVGRSRASAVAVRGRIYIVGGMGHNWLGLGVPLDSVECYDPSANMWTRLPGLMEARYGAGLAVHKDTIYIIGGHTALNVVLNSVEQMDTKRNVYVTLPNMSQSRGFVAAVQLEGYIYKIGGSDGQLNVSLVERYDIQAGTWSTDQSLPSTCNAAAACVVYNVARPEMWV